MENDEEIPQRAVYGIDILDLTKRKVIFQIKPPPFSDPFMYQDKWTREGTLLLHSADGFAVNYFYEYIPEDNEIKEISWERYNKFMEEDKVNKPQDMNS